MHKPIIISDEAIYDLLHTDLNRQLKKKFDVVEHQLLDGFDDVIDDFFLYLRDGKNGIKKPEAVSAFIINTFRNYLSARAAKEAKFICIEFPVDTISDSDALSSILTDEQKLSVASNLIAYAHQVLLPRDSFILFRTLLTILNKKQSLPNEVMAISLGMSAIAYRVTVHRMKCNLAKYRTQLLQGQHLDIDEKHQQMAQKINDNFLNLYPTLLVYYDQIVDTLGCADAIKNLRQEYYEETGMMLHEAETEYSVPITINYFWNRLKMFILYDE